MLKALNTSVHHEIIAPLKANVDIAKRLITCLIEFPSEQMLAQTILTSSQMVMLHAHDILDQRIIENGSFIPCYTEESVFESVKEMTQII